MINFPTSSAPGVNAQEGAGRLLNMYAEKTPPGARFPVLWRRTPGILQELHVSISSEVHCRGMFQTGSASTTDQAILVFNGIAYSSERTRTTGAWSAPVLIGGFTGTRQVTIAMNNAATPDVVAVDGAGGAWTLSPVFATYASVDADLPSSEINSVSVLNGYFLFTQRKGVIWSSNLNSTAVASNAFNAAQARTDGLLRGVAYRREFFAFGQNSIEVYEDIGASPFPLQFKTMIPRGIVGTHAVAGWEEGWSNELIWVADDTRVYRLDGYTPVPISNDDVSRAIATATDRRLLEAIVYMSGQNAFWELTSPGEWTWCYNLTTGEWHELYSDGRTDRRTSASFFIANAWIVGDRTTGRIGKVSSTTYQEFGGTLTWLMDSSPVHNFPGRLQIPRIDLDATKNSTASTVSISWSNDGGQTYGTAITRNLTGDYLTVNRLGMSKPKGKRFRLTGSSNTAVGFMGGQAAAIGRAA